MNFQTVEYISWFREKQRGIKYDLATSGLHPVSLSELSINLEDLNLGKTLFYGHPSLVELISEIYHVNKNEILITSGSTHANFLMCTLLLKEGDEVIIEHPVYTPLLDLVKAFKTKVRLIERKFEENYDLNITLLNEMATKNTKMIVFTNLHNPSGVAMNEKTLRAVKDIAEDNEIFVLSDEVYRDFIMEDCPPTFSSLTPMGISTCSLSKFYGSGALRVGWGMCDSELVERARNLNDYVLASNCCAGEYLGARILHQRDWFVKKVKKIMESNYPVFENWMNKREDLKWVAPKYGFIVFPRLRGDIDSLKLTEHLIKNYSTMISPGRFFGCENHIRLGLGGERKMLKEGLELLGSAMDEMEGSSDPI